MSVTADGPTETLRIPLQFLQPLAIKGKSRGWRDSESHQRESKPPAEGQKVMLITRNRVCPPGAKLRLYSPREKLSYETRRAPCHLRISADAVCCDRRICGHTCTCLSSEHLSLLYLPHPPSLQLVEGMNPAPVILTYDSVFITGLWDHNRLIYSSGEGLCLIFSRGL